MPTAGMWRAIAGARSLAYRRRHRRDRGMNRAGQGDAAGPGDTGKTDGEAGTRTKTLHSLDQQAGLRCN